MHAQENPMNAPNDTVDAAIETYKAARKKHAECVSSFELSQRRLEGDRTRLHDAEAALSKARRAILDAIGTDLED